MVDGQESNSSTGAAAPVSAPAPTGQANTAPSPVETQSQNGSAANQAQSAPAEDKFSNIDPETLPPELKTIYKSLQADYTKKTQSAAELRKKAQAYDKIVSRPDFSDFWNGMSRQQQTNFQEQKAQTEKALGERITDDEFAKLMQTKDGFLDLIAKVVEAKSEKSHKKLEELEQYRTVSEASRFVDTFATEVGEDGKPVRPDFYELDKDQLISGYLSVNPPQGTTEASYRQKLDEAYGWAKGLRDKFYEQGRAEALKVIQQKAAASTEPPTPPAKGVYTGGDPKKMSVREAMELAKKGIRVSRED